MKTFIPEKKMYLCLLLGVALSLCLNLLIEVLSIDRLFPTYSVSVKPYLFRLPMAAGLLLYGVVSPVVEELIFRRVFFKLLCTYVLVPAAGVASAVIFGIYHGNAVQFIYAFLFGLVLSYVYFRFDSLLSCILVHAAANIYVYLLYFLPVPGALQLTGVKVLIIMASGLISFLIIRYFINTSPGKSLEPEKPVFPK